MVGGSVPSTSVPFVPMPVQTTGMGKKQISGLQGSYVNNLVVRLKNEPSPLLYKNVGIFKSTKEVPREERALAECFSHFWSVLKNSQVLIELNARETSFFYSLICYQFIHSSQGEL